MKPCPETIRVQEYLDGELPPAERDAFRAHLAGCDECAAEVALYRVVFQRLSSLALLEPSSALADRVLEEVLPARPGRWVRMLGWAYAGLVGASLAALGAAIALPTPRAWTYRLAAEATRSLVGSFVFVLKAANATALRLLDGFSGGMSGRTAALWHAVATPLAQPLVVFTLWSALLTCAVVLWWMRPRERRAIRGSDHVGLLGL